MLKDGWRMQTSKPGLADLKRLRQLALEAEAPPAAKPPPKSAGRPGQKRKMAQSRAQSAAASGETGIGRPSAPATDAPGALDQEDKVLFRQAVKSVQPLAPVNRRVLPPIAVAPSAILKQRRHAAAGTEPVALAQVSDSYAPAGLAQDPTRFLQAGHGPDVLKSLAKGKWPIGASLDLHGASLDEARLRMDRFLHSCLQHHVRCVRIVHGKGYGSKNNQPILKDTVRRWLTQLEDVLAYTECLEQDGGAGAVQVLLRPPANE